MTEDDITIDGEKYRYRINNNLDIFMSRKGGNMKETHYKLDKNGKVSYYGRFVSDRLDMNTWRAIAMKTFR